MESQSDAVAQPPLATVERDREQDRRAVDHVLDVGALVVADERLVHEREEERADDGAGVVPGPAEDGAADDYRDDALEEVRVADAAVDAAGEAGDEHRDQRRADAAERER